MPTKPKLNREQGQIIIIALVFVVIVGMLVASLVGYALIQVRAHRQAVSRVQALNIAEAGVETAIWRLNHEQGYTGETNSSYANGTFTVATSSIGRNVLLVKVDAYIPNASNPVAHRKIQVTAAIGTKNYGFVYGLQVGNGGLLMDNNSRVTGNVYSNGNVIGGNNGSTVTGDVIVAGGNGISNLNINGNSRSHDITNSAVAKSGQHFNFNSSTAGGDVSANVLLGPGCSIAGKAAYNARTNCTIAGATVSPNPNVPADPPTLPLPIDQAQINAWEQEAAYGGTIPGTTISGTTTLGPIKVNGNLIINGTVTMNGTIWVTGNLTLTNGSTLKLNPDFGPLSGQVIAGTQGTTTDGYISVENGATISGSGSTGSYIMFISERDTTSNTNVAITVANNVAAAIMYANNGLIEVINNATVKEITAWKVHLNNLVSVVYDSGYASAEFSTGPTGGWEVAARTWQLLQ